MREESNLQNQIVIDFREKLEANACNHNSLELKYFPHGSCYSSSVLLYFYLKMKGYCNLEIVFAHRGGKSHVWLQNDSIFIDVTADQFDEVSEKVLITKKDMAHWHNTFVIDIIRNVDMADLVNLGLVDFADKLSII